jgi:hypothetical protein
LPDALPTPEWIRCRSCASVRRFFQLGQRQNYCGQARELLNIFQADEIGCHVITCTNDMIAKLNLVGRDLNDYSREAVQIFHRDAMAAGFSIRTAKHAAA